MALAVLPLFLLPVLLFSGLFCQFREFPCLAVVAAVRLARSILSVVSPKPIQFLHFQQLQSDNNKLLRSTALDQLGFGNDLSPGILIAILSGIYFIFVLAGYLVLLYKIKRH